MEEAVVVLRVGQCIQLWGWFIVVRKKNEEVSSCVGWSGRSVVKKCHFGQIESQILWEVINFQTISVSTPSTVSYIHTISIHHPCHPLVSNVLVRACCFKP